MSYQLHARGQIDIIPPLRYKQIKDSRFMPGYNMGQNVTDLKFAIEVDEETGGPIATGIVQRYDSDPRNGRLVEELQELVTEYPDHEFAGRFDLEGESSGDLRRVKIIKRVVYTFTPRLIWAPESE